MIISAISNVDIYPTTKYAISNTATAIIISIQIGTPNTSFFMNPSTFPTKSDVTGTDADVFPEVGFPKMEERDVKTEFPS